MPREDVEEVLGSEWRPLGDLFWTTLTAVNTSHAAMSLLSRGSSSMQITSILRQMSH